MIYLTWQKHSESIAIFKKYRFANHFKIPFCCQLRQNIFPFVFSLLLNAFYHSAKKKYVAYGRV
jgi:hypothetical protein